MIAPVPNRVDILLAAYNGEKYLQEQLDSLLAQTHGYWRIIARDDGSTDGTIKILQEFAQAHPGKLEIIHDRFGNLGAGRNFGKLMEYVHEHSDAAYLMFCDQDDRWYPDKIEKTLKAMHALEKENKPNLPLVVHTELHLTHANGSDMGLNMHTSTRVKDGTLKNQMLRRSMWGCTMMLNRPLLDLAVPMPESVYAHDEWAGLLARSVGKHHFIAEPTMDYRQHAANVSGNRRKYGPITCVKKYIHHRTKDFSTIHEVRERIVERKSEAAVPAILDEYIGIMDGPALLRPIKLANLGYNTPSPERTMLNYMASMMANGTNGRSH
jgi:glycosyltransferase involved in cell wall biosynthesis